MTTEPNDPRRARRTALLLFLAALLSALFFSYGGIRSPDSEIVFLEAESLAHRGTFALEHGCTLTNHGIARGVDGRLYSWYGPVQSLAWVPFIWLGDALGEETLRALARFAPANHNFSNGFEQFWFDHPKQDPVGDARRFLAAPLNAFVFAGTVAAFFLLALRLTGHARAAFLSAVLFGWCTLQFPYSGDAFSETFTTFFLVLALHALAPARPDEPLKTSRLLLGGLWLGLAVASHVTAVLFVPFIALLTQTPRRNFRAAFLFGAGLAVPCALLALHNWTRYGIPWETGRSVVAEVLQRAQGTVAPWRGLAGLTVGASNGLLFFCPVILLGILGWRAWRKTMPMWAWALLAAFAFRLIFISTRRDWHSGFGLGPRYFVTMIPVFIIPAAYWLREEILTERRTSVLLAGLLAAAAAMQQLYLAVGEYGSYYQAMRISYLGKNMDYLANDLIYTDWNASPLLGLHRGLRGPWFLREFPVSNITLWLLLALPAAALIFLLFRRAARVG